MITATARTDALLNALARRAGDLALRRGKARTHARAQAQGPTSWRSARSLWPDFGLD